MFRKRRKPKSIRQQRIKTRKVAYRRTVENWKNSLIGYPAFILGNAPSLEDIELDVLDNYFTIGINRIFYKFDPTVLMWQDVELMYSEKHLIPKLDAIKYCRDKADIQGRFYHFKLKNGPYQLPENADVLYGRGSSGPLAFQLAYILGCSPIIMLGMDCKYVAGKTDFYGKNPHHRPHTLRNCSKGIEWIGKVAKSQKIKTINCSFNDLLGPYVPLKQAISFLDSTSPTNRELFSLKILGSTGK